jgi:outer membrane lipoprotein-sorting protein
MTDQIGTRMQVRRAHAKTGISRWLLALALALALGGMMLTGSTAYAQSFDIDTLMHALAQHKSGHATFTETKTLSLLDKPVTSSGELSFRAPDHFEKRTLLPKPETLVVDGDTLTISRDGHDRTLSLVQYPEIAAAIESVRGTLTGERAILEQFYQIEVSGNAAHWRLVLVPKEARAAKQIAQITLAGTTTADGAAELETVQIDQTNHDRTVTTITAAASP